MFNLLPPQTSPFQGNFVESSIFGDPLIDIRFLVTDPVVIKTEEKMEIEEIKEELGEGSVFGEVPFLVFSGVFGRISIDQESQDFKDLQETLSISPEPFWFQYKKINKKK